MSICYTGTVVIVEKPYAFVLDETYTFGGKNCSVCLRDLNEGGIPCQGCVFVSFIFSITKMFYQLYNKMLKFHSFQFSIFFKGSVLLQEMC